MEKEPKRPTIPQKTREQLYIKAGGRCEFRGCNKYLFTDGVTRQPRKIGKYAHIVRLDTNRDHEEMKIQKNLQRIY